MKVDKWESSDECKAVVKYLIRQISNDGLIKPFREHDEPVFTWPIKTKVEAMEIIVDHCLDGAVILEYVDLHYTGEK